MYVDKVFEMLFNELGLEIPEYDPANDPTKQAKALRINNQGEFVEWTQSCQEARVWKSAADRLDTEFKAKKKLDRLKRKANQNGEEEEELSLIHI